MAANRQKTQRQPARATQQKPFAPQARERSDDADAFLPDPRRWSRAAPDELPNASRCPVRWPGW